MSLLSYYKLNGNSNDSSGNGYNGTDVNMSYNTVGAQNGSAKFTDTTTRISSSSSASNMGSGDRTISLWGRVNAVGATGRLFTNRNNNSTWFSIAIGENYFLMECAGPYPSKFNVWYSYDGYTNYKWRHYVFLVKGNDHYTFLNGNCVLQATITPYSFGNYTTRFAVYYDGGSYYQTANASLDNVYCRNDALPFAKIKNEYSYTKGFF